MKNPLGQKGEQLAAAYLQQNHYTIVTRNWHCASGEIDIIASKENTLVFVEVRSRHATSTEAAFISVSENKRKKMASSAYSYLHEHKLEDKLWRVDVIAIAVPRVGQPIIEHLENALDW